MEREKALDALDDPPASTAVYVALPRAADAAGTVNYDRQPRRPSSVSARRGQSAPARLLTRLMSAGADDGERRRLLKTANDANTSAFRSLRTLFRALPSFSDDTRSPVAESFRCYICFDDVSATEAITLSSCGHRYCHSCFQSYLSSKINEGHVHPVCFHPLEGGQNQNDDTVTTTQTTCGVAIADDQIQSIVDADVWAKFNKFRFTQEHGHARECPHCAFTQECAGPTNPMCVCSQCEKMFCFVHGNAHEYGTCSDYELKNAEAEALNRAVINEVAKPCPGCSRDIEKDGGCNHMTCVACQTSFCWLCGEAMENVGAHYDRDGGGACSGKQFDGVDRAPVDEPIEEPRSTKIAFAISLALALVFFFPPLLVMALLVWLFSRNRDIEDVFDDVLDSIVGRAARWFVSVCLAVMKVVFFVIEFVLILVWKIALLFFTGVALTAEA